jgi:hypothetical protein
METTMGAIVTQFCKHIYEQVVASYFRRACISASFQAASIALKPAPVAVRMAKPLQLCSSPWQNIDRQ